MDCLIALKQTPYFYQLRHNLFLSILLSGKENQPLSPKVLRSAILHKAKHSNLPGMINALKQPASGVQQSQSVFKFYHAKWTELMLKNFSALCQSGNLEGHIYSWSSFFNFLYLAREELVYAIRIQKTADFRQFLMESRERKSMQDKRALKVQKGLDVESFSDSDLECLARKGLTTGMRAQVYLEYFESALEDQDFEEMLASAQKAETFLDQLLEADVEASIDDSEEYFVFKEQIKLLCKVFIRDQHLLQECPFRPCDLIQRSVFRSGVVPCKGFSLYLAPFFYLSQDLQMVYLLFRQFYIRYFSKLHSIHTSTHTIGCLLSLFRFHFQAKAPDLHTHLLALDIKAEKVAFSWIFHCFVGVFEVAEVLKLLDLIIGHGSLECLVHVAVGAMLMNRRGCLCNEERERVLQQLGEQKVSVESCLARFQVG